MVKGDVSGKYCFYFFVCLSEHLVRQNISVISVLRANWIIQYIPSKTAKYRIKVWWIPFQIMHLEE